MLPEHLVNILQIHYSRILITPEAPLALVFNSLKSSSDVTPKVSNADRVLSQ